MRFFFFFNDTATTEIYTLSLHDALPICSHPLDSWTTYIHRILWARVRFRRRRCRCRSEEHTSELQSHSDLVCRLLLEKKNIHDHNGHVYRLKPRQNAAVNETCICDARRF